MPFFQQPPSLGNQFDDDQMLADYLARTLPADELAAIAPQLAELGDLSGDYFYKFSLADRDNEPVHTPWDAWGNRVDRIDVSPLWQQAGPIAARYGLVAAGYETQFGAHARIHQFAMVHVIGPALDVFTCPLAMTDGATRTLLSSGNRMLIDAIVPHLISRDPHEMWTSGQWMTERTGGSDVGLTETIARKIDGTDDSARDAWRLHGTKWFTSATTAQVALTLARPEGNPGGSHGLALFAVNTRDEHDRLRGITVNRLKDKLGTRKVPTAELTLDGAPATLVGAPIDGVRAITPMLSITRTWNSICAIGLMRRGLALARDYSRHRVAFGALLVDKPLHADTLAALEAEYAGAFLLAFRAAELLGRVEHGVASDDEQHLARALVPIAKLTTGKQVVAALSEAIECCGGAGYVEDTGLPRLLADAQVLPIWEGTTNVLSLDTLRVFAKGDALRAIGSEVASQLALATDASLGAPVAAARTALDHALQWASQTMGNTNALEAGARRLALTLGRTLELAHLCAHAQWCLDNGRGPRAAAAARRLAIIGVDLIATDVDAADSKLLA